MEFNKKHDADEVKQCYCKAGDILVVTKKRCGDPYMIMLKTAIFICERKDGSRYTLLSQYNEMVSLYNHRVFYDIPEDPKDEPAVTRMATEEERKAYIEAIAKVCIESMFNNLAEGTSERWSKIGFLDPQTDNLK